MRRNLMHSRKAITKRNNTIRQKRRNKAIHSYHRNPEYKTQTKSIDQIMNYV